MTLKKMFNAFLFSLICFFIPSFVIIFTVITVNKFFTFCKTSERSNMSNYVIYLSNLKEHLNPVALLIPAYETRLNLEH